MAVANSGTPGGTGSVTVLVNDGEAGFAQHPASPYDTGGPCAAVLLIDRNADNSPDLLVSHSANPDVDEPPQLSVYLNGGGTFVLWKSYPCREQSTGLARASIDMDIFDDVLVCGPCLQVFLGRSDGGFQSPDQYAAGTWTYRGEAVQANALQDSLPDLIITDCSLTNSGFSVMLNSGGAGFSDPYVVSGGAQCMSYWIASGDLWPDPSGLVDVAITNIGFGSQTGSVSVFAGQGDGNFVLAQEIAPSTNESIRPWYIAAGDINSDLFLDLIVAHAGQDVPEIRGTISFLLWNPSLGQFQLRAGEIPIQPGAPGARREPWGLVTADFNQDGHIDFAFVDGVVDMFKVYYGDGTSYFHVNRAYAERGGPWSSLASADMNKDGYPDLLMTSREEEGPDRVYVRLNDPWSGPDDERFPDELACWQETSRAGVVTYAEPYGFGTGDLTGDSYPDVVLVNHGVTCWTPSVCVFEWDEQEDRLLERDEYGCGRRPTAVVVEDFDPVRGGTSALDVAVLHELDGDIPNVYVMYDKNVSRAGRAPLGGERLRSTDTDTRLQVRPNPLTTSAAISFGSTNQCGVCVRIYTVSGRLVRELLCEPTSDGARSVMWDGLDQDGVAVASGIYFCRADAGEGDLSAKLVVIR